MAIARYSLTALDCPDPVELANFYSQITGFEVVVAHRRKDGQPQWVELVEIDQTRIAFQKIDNYRKPTWPDGPVPQQAHLDFDVPDLNVAEQLILRIGAEKSTIQPSSNPDDNFRVYFDPVGHPFCLVKRSN
jgi:hypothetical protein